MHLGPLGIKISSFKCFLILLYKCVEELFTIGVPKEAAVLVIAKAFKWVIIAQKQAHINFVQFKNILLVGFAQFIDKS